MREAKEVLRAVDVDVEEIVDGVPMIEKLFAMLDKDNDAQISFEELKGAFESHSFK